jgi:hypothetical protein
MRTAVVCLAYLKNVDGVKILADYFSDTETDLYIHVDAKSDASAYQDFAKDRHNVFLTPNRFPIYWGGFNTVRSAIASLEYARRSAEYGRFLFLTEDTIPIVSKAEFAKRMSSDVEFFETKIASGQNMIDRYNGFFYFDSFATTPRPCPTVARAVTAEDLLALSRLNRLRDKGKVVLKDIHHGGTWWGLTAQAVNKIVSSYYAEEHLRESFEFSAIPEEQYFHTILRLEKSEPLLFTDWSRNPTPFVFRTSEEIAEVDAKGRTFLRKVDIKSESIKDFVRSLA